MRGGFTIAAGLCATLWCVALWTTAAAQRGGMFMGSPDDPAVAYSTGALSNPVDTLNRRLRDGSQRLVFEGRSGYLRSTLDALGVPADSQLLVYTKLSLQGRQVSAANPRAIYFDDRVAVAWVRDAELIEIATHDDRQGVVFYTLKQHPERPPAFEREFRCLGCHMNADALGVPGLLMFSTTPEAGDEERKVTLMDQRSPLSERWGGWFVTGAAITHRGNQVPALASHRGPLPSVAGLFDADGYRAESSDVAALLAFSHQTHMTNLLTRASWEARIAEHGTQTRTVTAAAQTTAVEALMSGVAAEVVDYMLFVDEAPLTTPIGATSPFAMRMAERGPKDRRGRSLYQLDLTRRMMKYPCSYLIYSPAFDALPPLAKQAIYQRLWQVLSGAAKEPRYRTLSLADRRAIVEILRDTKPDLPTYFTRVTR